MPTKRRRAATTGVIQALEKTESSQPLAPQTRGLSQTIFVVFTKTHSSPRMHSLKKPTNVDTHHLIYRVQVTASGCCAAHKAAHVFTPHLHTNRPVPAPVLPCHYATRPPGPSSPSWVKSPPCCSISCILPSMSPIAACSRLH